jgi:hypothetical protein
MDADLYQAFWAWMREWNGVKQPGQAAATRLLPPPGVLLLFADAQSRRCGPEECVSWTFEGAERWFRRNEGPLPAVRLAARRGYRKRCRSCDTERLRFAWRRFSNGTDHLAAECDVCGKFVAFVTPPPRNLEIEYRADGEATSGEETARRLRAEGQQPLAQP